MRSNWLGRWGICLIVYGIEGKCFESGIGLSPELEAATGLAVVRIKAEVEESEGTG